MLRRMESMMGSGMSRIMNHMTDCTQYGVMIGSCPTQFSAHLAYCSAEGVVKEGRILDIFVATYRGTCTTELSETNELTRIYPVKFNFIFSFSVKA